MPEGFVTVGRILRPWGVRGHLKVEPLTDFPDRFSPGSLLYIDGVAHRVEECRWRQGRAYIKLSGIDGTAAQALRGRSLSVPEGELRPLPEGCYYQFQLLGLAVRDRQGRPLGRVAEILSTAGNDVLVVRGPGGELLLPALEDVILKVDLEGGWMEVDPPPSL